VEAIDTTGAGDAFIGAMLKQICEKLPEDFNEVKHYVSFANKVAAISTTQFGGIEAIPTLEEVLKICKD
jgi:fructokinase